MVKTSFHDRASRPCGACLTAVLVLWALAPLPAFCEEPAAGQNAPKAGKAPQAEAPGVDERDAERFRQAGETLQSARKMPKLLGAMNVLRKGFPGSRDVLHECVLRGTRQAKSLALRVLGEVGDPAKDRAVILGALSDREIKVRRAAVMAVRKLGTDDLSAFLQYLRGEQDPNNRKMAIKTLQHWDDAEVAPALVSLLKREKDHGVRNFLVTALRALTHEKYGDNVKAWERYLENVELRRQADILLDRAPLKERNARKLPEEAPPNAPEVK